MCVFQETSLKCCAWWPTASGRVTHDALTLVRTCGVRNRPDPCAVHLCPPEGRRVRTSLRRSNGWDELIGRRWTKIHEGSKHCETNDSTTPGTKTRKTTCLGTASWCTS